MTRVQPGVTACLAAGIASLLLQKLVPGASALLVAIIAGIALANIVTLPEWIEPGRAVASKKVLRFGIVLLGFSISLGDIAALGWGVVLTVILTVFIGLFGTIAIGRRLGVSHSQSVLIGAGFSICGAAAVAGVESTIRRKDSEVATAIGLVVIYGTLMIGIVPLVLGLVGFDDRLNGLIAGASIHEVAQVVAVGGIMGGGVLTVAVIVKLARVLMLAPVIAVLNLMERGRGTGVQGSPVPAFVAGFIAATIVTTFVDLPGVLLSAISIVQTICLASAMFALGLGIRFSAFKQVGFRPVLLGALSTLLVTAVASTGMILLG
ncbi:putative sulfate exporter family transporter [Flaviflexus salsibiostraticola]|uniref:Putative sulfate exporter family transporter n=1 Tax=Flaviflexus salsibiostraticola TaxID=1282737 RepID=A0A3Q8WSD6_9ACTO|nr:putative sulfate exporter family transporter [Flaviflexus salsibiostraticola]AZN28961.1 putative sulfate exporter family transporter [Flaviflexus salsibiostraticola]